MALDVIFASVPRGLLPGTSGHCVAACSNTMSASMMRSLEMLSEYRRPEQLSEREFPVKFSLLHLDSGGVSHAVLSRVAAAGLDYRRQISHLAHHVVVRLRSEQPGRDPAWLFEHYRDVGLLIDKWEGEPEYRREITLPAGIRQAGKCTAWADLVADTGWGGWLAQTAQDPTVKHVTLIFPKGVQVLPLVIQSLSLLPVEERWQVTFSTSFTTLAPTFTCRWRFVLEGSPEALRARHSEATPILDLCRGTALGAPPAGALVEAARSGELPKPEEDLLGTTHDDIARVRLKMKPPAREEDISLQGASLAAGLPQPPIADPPIQRRRPISPIEETGAGWKIALIGLLAGVLVLGGIAAVLLTSRRMTRPPVSRRPERLREPDVRPDPALAERKRREEAEALERIEARLAEVQKFADEAARLRKQFDALATKRKLAETDFTRWEEEYVKINQLRLAAANREQIAPLLERAETVQRELEDWLKPIAAEATRIQEVTVKLRDEIRELDMWQRQMDAQWRIMPHVTKLQKSRDAILALRNDITPLETVLRLAARPEGSKRVADLIASLKPKMPEEQAKPVEEAVPVTVEPFEHLAKLDYQVSLPEPLTGGLAETPEPAELARLYLKDPSSCQLRLLGDFSAGNRMSLDPVATAGGPPTWTVMAKLVLGSAEPIGDFSLAPVADAPSYVHAFRFRWRPGRGSELNRQLVNALLVVQVGDETQKVQLRRAVERWPTLSLDNAMLVDEAVPLPSFPLEGKIVLEVSSRGLPGNQFAKDGRLTAQRTGSATDDGPTDWPAEVELDSFGGELLKLGLQLRIGENQAGSRQVRVRAELLAGDKLLSWAFDDKERSPFVSQIVRRSAAKYRSEAGRHSLSTHQFEVPLIATVAFLKELDAVIPRAEAEVRKKEGEWQTLVQLRHDRELKRAEAATAKARKEWEALQDDRRKFDQLYQTARQVRGVEGRMVVQFADPEHQVELVRFKAALR